jgi:hypothetical protein
MDGQDDSCGGATETRRSALSGELKAAVPFRSKAEVRPIEEDHGRQGTRAGPLNANLPARAPSSPSAKRKRTQHLPAAEGVEPLLAYTCSSLLWLPERRACAGRGGGVSRARPARGERGPDFWPSSSLPGHRSASSPHIVRAENPAGRGERSPRHERCRPLATRRQSSRLQLRPLTVRRPHGAAPPRKVPSNPASVELDVTNMRLLDCRGGTWHRRKPSARCYARPIRSPRLRSNRHSFALRSRFCGIGGVRPCSTMTSASEAYEHRGEPQGGSPSCHQRRPPRVVRVADANRTRARSAKQEAEGEDGEQARRARLKPDRPVPKRDAFL